MVGDLDLIKVHVHTNMPGKALQLALRFGELSGIKIDNMKEQHRHVIIEKKQKEYGVVAVAMGDGISSILRILLLTMLSKGTDNEPPVLKISPKRVEQTNAKNVFVLPNNSNIILSAKQAQEISDSNIIVIPSKSIPQGLAAILAFNPDSDIDTNITNMTEAMESVSTGQVTYAVRDSEYNGITIKKDDIIGLADGKIVTAGKDIKRDNHIVVRKRCWMMTARLLPYCMARRLMRKRLGK